jgi:hypothetical protein
MITANAVAEGIKRGATSRISKFSPEGHGRRGRGRGCRRQRLRRRRAELVSPSGRRVYEVLRRAVERRPPGPRP